MTRMEPLTGGPADEVRGSLRGAARRPARKKAVRRPGGAGSIGRCEDKGCGGLAGKRPGRVSARRADR